MTYTKRSNAPSARIAAKGLFSADVAGPFGLMNGKLSGCSCDRPDQLDCMLETGAPSP